MSQALVVYKTIFFISKLFRFESTKVKTGFFFQPGYGSELVPAIVKPVPHLLRVFLTPLANGPSTVTKDVVIVL